MGLIHKKNERKEIYSKQIYPQFTDKNFFFSSNQIILFVEKTEDGWTTINFKEMHDDYDFI